MIREREELVEFFELQINSLPEEERRPYLIMKEVCEKQIEKLIQTYSIKENTSVS